MEDAVEVREVLVAVEAVEVLAESGLEEVMQTGILEGRGSNWVVAGENLCGEATGTKVLVKLPLLPWVRGSTGPGPGAVDEGSVGMEVGVVGGRTISSPVESMPCGAGDSGELVSGN